MTDHADSLIERGGVSIAVRDLGGGGPPLVLLHGGGRTLCDWALVLPLLLPHHRCVAMDLRGHGRSAPCDGRWDLGEAAADVEAVIGHLGLGDPFVAGHSLGGIVATVYGDGHPECPGVVSVDGVGVTIPARFPGPDAGAERARVVDAIGALVAGDAPAPVAPAEPVEPEEMRRRLAEAGRRGDDRCAAERAFHRLADGRFVENPTPATLRALGETVIALDAFALIRRVRCPLLFVGAAGQDAEGGGMDEIMRLWSRAVGAELETIAREHPGVRSVSVASGHMVPLEAPRELAAALLAFTGAAPA
jgi:pimeloyl-ACP methyl ester carboxylesterase